MHATRDPLLVIKRNIVGGRVMPGVMRPNMRWDVSTMEMKEKSQLARPVAVRSCIIFLIILTSFAPLLADTLPQFEAYPAPPYRGVIHRPEWIRRGGSGEWRDDLGKLVDDPEVNFAGRYFICVHSCGTGCRYYTLTDLSSGRDLDLLEMFATAEPTPKTRDGRDYLTELFSHPDSRMLVAQYHIGLYQGEGECRERVFLFDGGKLKPITGTRRGCREF